MQSITQLETNLAARPNSIEINQALADAYVEQSRWQDAAVAYRSLLSLYPATASLFVNRIRLGAAALIIASIFILVAQILQPPLQNPQKSPVEFAEFLAAREYLLAQIFFLLAFPLLSTAVISIYKLLSYSRDHRPAFWAMVFSVLGIGLFMPSLGINAVVLPLIGRLYLAGELGVLAIYYAIQEYPWSLILQFGRYLLLIGVGIFSWVIWRNKGFPKWAVVSYLVGWILFLVSNNHVAKFEIISIGILIALGGTELARSIWIQASLQFTPVVESLQKAES
ncbi:MAG TPA: hypothetical protein VN843_11755 [Anaerolineales bacterium]|nr:hypothetical protein [Anaerolineales bacterium]